MSFELNENNQAIRRYIYENGKDDVQGYVEYAEVDDPQYFSFERKGWYSYIKDQVGTITKVYKHQTKQMVDTRTYDVFGNVINQSGSSAGNLGFQSKYYDQESGLNYYYHRYYYPSIGRFINEDPIGLNGGLNMYGFTDNNPVNEIDPIGLQTHGRIRSYKDLDNFDPDNKAMQIDINIDMFNDAIDLIMGNFTSAVKKCYYFCFWNCMAFGEAYDFILKEVEKKVYLKGIKIFRKHGQRSLAKILIYVLKVSSKLQSVTTAIEAYICHIKCARYL